MKKITNKGFTIVEVLIASLVFSALLLLCMEGIVRIAKVYVKNSSINQANEFSKSFSGDITQQIKYGAEPKFTPGNPSFLCVSDSGYKIEFNKSQEDSAQNPVVKIEDVGCTLYNNSSNYSVGAYNPVNIAPNNIRILKFNLTNTGLTNPVWVVNMRVAIGAKDLLVDSSNKPLTDPSSDPTEALCKPGIAGSEFCAVIGISTAATRRMR